VPALCFRLRMSKKPRTGDIPRMGAEYGDEVAKINKKEDLMLARKLKFLDRQEKVAWNLIRKNMKEIEKLKTSITNDSCRATDLIHYDMKRSRDKASRYGSVHYERNPTNVRLPPITGATHGAFSEARRYRGDDVLTEQVPHPLDRPVNELERRPFFTTNDKTNKVEEEEEEIAHRVPNPSVDLYSESSTEFVLQDLENDDDDDTFPTG